MWKPNERGIAPNLGGRYFLDAADEAAEISVGERSVPPTRSQVAISTLQRYQAAPSDYVDPTLRLPPRRGVTGAGRTERYRHLFVQDQRRVSARDSGQFKRRTIQTRIGCHLRHGTDHCSGFATVRYWWLAADTGPTGRQRGYCVGLSPADNVTASSVSIGAVNGRSDAARCGLVFGLCVISQGWVSC